MTRRVLVLVVAVVAALAAVPAAGQQARDPQADEDTRLLVYSRTAGFRHLSIPDGIAAIEELGRAHGFAVRASEDPAVFTDGTLDDIDGVVFLNTTGEVMTPEGRAAFERWVRDGGGYIGVHAAADTEYTWDFYGRLLGGAWFLAHPVQQPGVVVNEAPEAPSTAHLPERWLLPLEEFYSFVANPREHVRVLLSIDESTYLQDPNTSHLPTGPSLPEGVSGVMGDHPMSWCVDVGAGRGWYSALGHESYLYQLADYRQHLLGGILTALQQVDADCSATSPWTAPAAGPAQPAPAYPPAPSQDGGAPGPDGAPDGVDPLPATGTPATVPLLGVAVLLAAAALPRRRDSGGAA